MLNNDLPRRARALLLFLALCLPLTPALGQDNGDYEQKLKELALTIENLKKTLAETKGARNDLQQSLQSSEEEIGRLTAKIERIQGEIASGKKQLARYKGQRSTLEDARQQQAQEVQRIARQAYRLGNQNQVKLMLNQEDPSQIARLMRYHDYVIDAHKSKMDRYLQTIADIERNEQRINEATSSLDQKHQQLQQRFSALKQSQAERLATLDKLTRSLAQQGEQLAQGQRDQTRLERLLKEASRALSQLAMPSDAAPFRSVKGKLPYPAKGKVTHRFGSYRVADKLRWNGIFIQGASGRDVVAVHYGRVIFSDYLRGHGLLIIVDHGDGYMSLYAHNQALLKETGDWVSRNETIAIMGNSGGQTQAGLYFEIRHQGKPQNPSPWLDKLS